MKQLVEIQNELKAPKSQFNKFGGYKYRNAEDILEAVKPLLFKHKCTLTISDDIVCAGDRIYVKATAIISNGADSISVSAFAREPEAQKGMSESQITGASSSYARKYALNGMFAIDDTKDSDATNDGKEDDGKPWLNKNTPQFDAAYKYVLDGGKITDIEKKYKLSKEIKEQLNIKP